MLYEQRQRRQQALRNKLKIQNHTEDAESSLEHQSTLPSRPRPKKSTPIEVFVNTIMGFTINITAKSTDTVERLKQMIQEQEDIPYTKQILILDGVPLDDLQFLTEYTHGPTLHVLLRLQAGTGSVGSIMTPSSTMATVPRKKQVR